MPPPPPARPGAAVVGVALFFLIGTVEARLLKRFDPDVSVLSVGLVTGVTQSLVATVWMTRLGLWHRLGFRQPERRRDLILFAPFVLIGFLPLTAGVQARPGTVLAWVIAAAMIAYFKMVVLGFLLHSFRSQRAWRAAGLAASVFAVMELGGLLGGGASVATSALSVMYLFLAFAYGAAWLRTGVLWPLIIGNALMTISVAATQRTIDASNLAVSVEAVMRGMGLALMVAVYGGFLLRKCTGSGTGLGPSSTSTCVASGGLPSSTA
jgi:hypothetical protein